MLQDRSAHAVGIIKELEAIMDPHISDGPAPLALLRDEDCKDIVEQILLDVAKKDEILQAL
jgi:hypothetical protein